jgi:transcriptional activator of cad operon
MDVLVYLADHANELVSRHQLLKSVWSEHVAADELLTGAVSHLRLALQDHHDDPKFIETIPKRGYRIIESVKDIEQDLPKEKGWRTISTLRNWSRRAFQSGTA